MKEGTRDGNKDRTSQGHEPIELLGWAEPPHYDDLARKIYWAKELKFGSSDVHTTQLRRPGPGSRRCVVHECGCFHAATLGHRTRHEGLAASCQLQ